MAVRASKRTQLARPELRWNFASLSCGLLQLIANRELADALSARPAIFDPTGCVRFGDLVAVASRPLAKQKPLVEIPNDASEQFHFRGCCHTTSTFTWLGFPGMGTIRTCELIFLLMRSPLRTW